VRYPFRRGAWRHLKIFVRYEQGVLGDYRVGAREQEVIARSDLLMAVLYAQVEGFFESVMRSPSAGLRAVDFGDLAGLTGGPRVVERYPDGFHVGFFGLTAADGGLVDALERLARRQGQLYAVTLGPDGSLALGGGGRLRCPATPVAEVVDTTGAGDTFAAGFLREYVASRDVARSLARGAEEAAVSVQQVGAFPWED
jgi:fructoselysine 6-kinase